MCSIIGSFNNKKFIDLTNQNQYRGSFSYSLSLFDINEGIKTIIKDFGLFDNRMVPEDENKELYLIGHVQAPTGGLIKDIHKVHPSVIDNTYLWHNGIIKSNCIHEMQKEFKTTNDWDTSLLHMAINKFGFEILSDIDGSFGCVYINGSNFYIFTNDAIALYMDDNFNISSTKFENSDRIESNIVYGHTLQKDELTHVCSFKSKSSPYFIL